MFFFERSLRWESGVVNSRSIILFSDLKSLNVIFSSSKFRSSRYHSNKRLGCCCVASSSACRRIFKFMAAHPLSHCPYQDYLSHCQPQPARSLFCLAHAAPATAAAAGPALLGPCRHLGVCIDPLDVACAAAAAAVHFTPTPSPHAPPLAPRLEVFGRQVAAQSGRLRCGPWHARQRSVDSCCLSRNTCQRDVSSTVSTMG